jgi:hypothetical protein
MMVEDVTDFTTAVEYDKSKITHKRIAKYSHDEIIYHISQCERAGLIENVKYYDNGDFVIIDDLTPKGHEFIENIRQDTVWNGVKSIAKKIGSTSLSAVVQISSNVISEIIKAQFGIGGTPLIP